MATAGAALLLPLVLHGATDDEDEDNNDTVDVGPWNRQPAAGRLVGWLDGCSLIVNRSHN